MVGDWVPVAETVLWQGTRGPHYGGVMVLFPHLLVVQSIAMADRSCGETEARCLAVIDFPRRAAGTIAISQANSDLLTSLERTLNDCSCGATCIAAIAPHNYLAWKHSSGSDTFNVGVATD
jgi:hypothetical protein